MMVGGVGHLSKACPKPSKERETGGRGQPRGRGHNDEKETGVVFTDEDHMLLEMLKRKPRAIDGCIKGNTATYAHSAKDTHDTHTLVSISTTRSPKWIVDSGASRHVTGTASEFFSYTHLAVPESIQTADGTAQPVVGKVTVKCTNSMNLSNVLHAPSFPVNLLSISGIILQLNCVVSFDIPKVIFQEKRTGRRLGTDTWHSGLWYLDREGMDSTLTSIVESVGVGGSGRSVEDVLMLHHRRMGYSSFNLLSRLYPSLYEKADKQKLMCDACVFGKHTRSSYVSSVIGALVCLI